mmetsp:Transcript_27062/g.71069  ORF Transcript_27062/g.71069 Transcript_27062/m.71069 type:complete len:122 (-) Transcript_27062:151-516(-)
MPPNLGIPIKLLHEATGHVVTVELSSGDMYRGKLTNVEDNMNVTMDTCTRTDRSGRTSELQQIFIRGGHVRYFVIPDMLRHSPMFKNQEARLKGHAIGAGVGGVGKTAMLRRTIEGRGRRM